MDRKPFRTTRPIVNLRQGRNDWYRLTNSAGATAAPASLHIYDEIGFFGVTAQDLIAELAGVDGDLDVHLNTPGGEVFDGIAIYNALTNRTGTVRVYVDSLAASIGSVIAMAASPGELIMARNATMMIHDGFGMALGNAADMREMADLLDKMSDNIASVYADRTGKPAAHWRGLMLAETWFTGQEAVDAGLADRVQAGRNGEPANTWDLSVFRNARRASAAPAGDDGAAQCPACGAGNDPGAVFCDQCGTMIDPGADGGPDDGGMGNRARSGLQNAGSVDRSEWDAAKAWHNGAESDDPAAFYAGICAGRKAGDKATQAAWALPYKYSPSSAPNADGVRAALARLASTEGLTNEDEARTLLERLMKQVNPDYAPDDSADLSWIAQLDLTAFEEATK